MSKVVACRSYVPHLSGTSRWSSADDVVRAILLLCKLILNDCLAFAWWNDITICVLKHFHWDIKTFLNEKESLRLQVDHYSQHFCQVLDEAGLLEFPCSPANSVISSVSNEFHKLFSWIDVDYPLVLGNILSGLETLLWCRLLFFRCSSFGRFFCLIILLLWGKVFTIISSSPRSIDNNGGGITRCHNWICWWLLNFLLFRVCWGIIVLRSKLVIIAFLLLLNFLSWAVCNFYSLSHGRWCYSLWLVLRRLFRLLLLDVYIEDDVVWQWDSLPIPFLVVDRCCNFSSGHPCWPTYKWYYIVLMKAHFPETDPLLFSHIRSQQVVKNQIRTNINLLSSLCAEVTDVIQNHLADFLGQFLWYALGEGHKGRDYLWVQLSGLIK